MKTTEEILDMMRHHDTPLTDAVINTFDGNQSKLAADLATHVEELERELEQSRQDRIAGAECSKRLAAKLANCSRVLNAPVIRAARDVVDRWETPLWKDAPATATFIHRLRDALSSASASRLASADPETPNP